MWNDSHMNRFEAKDTPKFLQVLDGVKDHSITPPIHPGLRAVPQLCRAHKGSLITVGKPLNAVAGVNQTKAARESKQEKVAQELYLAGVDNMRPLLPDDCQREP
jgi:hypothetical protein